MYFNSRALILVIFGLAVFLRATTASEWELDADGNWIAPSNWLGPIPDSSNATALFGPAISGNRVVSLIDPSDSNITASQLAFDGHFGYLVELQTAQKLTFSGNPAASILMPATLGNAQQNIDYVSITSGATIALPQTFTIRNDSSGLFRLHVPGRGSNVVLTKLGPGGVNLGMGSQNYSGSTQVLVSEGTFEGSVSFADHVTLNGGRMILTGTSSPNATSIAIGPAGGTIEKFAGSSGWGVSKADFFSGSGTLTKEGLGAVRVIEAQPNFNGAIRVRGGQLNLSSSSLPFLNATAFHISGASGIFAGQLQLSTTILSDVPVTIGSGGILVAPSGAGYGLATLTRGGNLTAAPGSVIAQTAPGGNASVQGLGPTQDLFFGISGTQNIPSLTVGTGTPWQGISGLSSLSTTLNSSSSSGIITANGDFTIQHYDQLVKLNNTSIISSGDRRAVTIAAPTAGSLSQGAATSVLPAGISTVGEGVTLSASSNLGGVSKFVVTNGATFTISSAGVLGTGTTQAPVIEMQAGGDFTKTAISTPTVLDTLGVGNAAATILIKGPSHVSVASPIDVKTPLGGRFVIESRLPSSVGLGSTTSGIGADSLTFAVSGASVNALGSVEGSTTTTGSDTAINVSGDSSSIGTLNLRGGLIGAGVVTKGSGGTLSIDAAKSIFAGAGSQLRIDAGVVQLNNGSFDTSPNGPEIYIGRSPRIGVPGIFSVAADVDAGAKLTADSTGIIALRADNSTLKGVNDSSAFIGADGAHNLTTSLLEPGLGGVYRLGGGINTPVLNLTGANVLAGLNDVVVGMPESTFGSVLKNGSGTVSLKNSNSFTGSTKINTRSTLAIEGANAIGGGSTAAGPIAIDGTMVIRSGGSIGQTGVITINYEGEFQIDDTNSANPNRVPDATPIHLRGGTISYFNSDASRGPSTETVAQVGSGLWLLEGDSTIDLTPKTALATSKLTVGEIHREHGATLELKRFSGQPVSVGNAGTFVANGIIPWIDNDNGAISTSTAAGDIVSYTGPFQSQIEGAAATDNVLTTSSVNALSADRTINSLKLFGNVDLAGHVLNIGTAPINGIASGALILSSPQTLGTGNQPGFLTAGQAVFSPTSATPGELILRAVGNPATIAASVIDNAGHDGVFGNADDLPVTVTLMSDGTVNMTGAKNSYTGGTFINRGTLNSTSFIPGNVTLHAGKLQFSSTTPDTYLVGGNIIVSNSANLSTSITPLIQVPTYSGPSTQDLASRTPYLFHGLTVTPGSVLFLRGDIAITGDLPPGMEPVSKLGLVLPTCQPCSFAEA